MTSRSECHLRGGAIATLALGAGLATGLAGCEAGAGGPFAERPRPAAAIEGEAWRRAADRPSQEAATLGEEPTTGDYIRLALERNGAVEAAYQRYRAARSRVPQATALPDPRVSLGFFLDEVETRVGPQKARVGLSQAIPWPQRLEAQGDAASRAALAAWRRFEAERLAVERRVRQALRELAYLEDEIAITRDNLALLGQLEAVARARYRVAAAGHPDVVRAQLELATLEDRVRELEAMRGPTRATLNAALDRPIDAPAPLPADLPERLFEGESEALLREVRSRNLELEALGEEVERRRALHRAARLADAPELTLSLDYIVTGEAMDPSIPESGDDPIMLGGSVNVPIWRSKYRGMRAEALAERLAAARTREDRARLLEAAARRALFQHADAHRRALLHEQTLIPKAEESLNATLRAFETGALSFLDLIEAERALLDYRLAHSRARADRAIALATLEELAGGPLETADLGAAGPEEPPQETQDAGGEAGEAASDEGTDDTEQRGGAR